MSDSNSNFVDPNTDDLDAFNTLLHGHATEVKAEDTEEPASSEEEIVEDNADADVEDDTLETEDETDDEGGSEEEEGNDDESEPEPDPKPVQKKNRVQERIDELTRERYEEKRRADALEAKLDAILAQVKPKTDSTPKEQDSDGPSPDALNEDGTEKYPLGEFDPAYIRDLTRHTIAQETQAAKIAQEEADRIAAEETAQAELATEWSGKLEAAKEVYPDIQDKNYALVEAFSDLDPAYGEYLAATIMSMNHGTDVLYHLASNLDEARRIIASGPTKATIALGRLEARYELQKEEIKERKLKVSNAPTPPPQINKGAASVTSIAPDTDDLDAFETLLFQKKKRR